MRLYSAFIFVCLALPASAQTTWFPSNAVWNTASNWNNGLPGAGIVAQFDNAPAAANRLLTFTANAVAGSIVFTQPINTTYTFTSTVNTLTLDNGGSGSAITVPASTTVNIAFNMAMNLTDAGGTIITNNGTGILQFNSVGTQATTIGAGGLTLGGTGNFAMSSTGDVAGSGTITKTGSGTLTMGSGNTWSGKLVVAGGVFSFAADTAFGVVPSALVPDAITLSGGTLTSTTSTVINANRGITLGAGTNTFAGTVTTTASNITGTGALTKTQSGTLTLLTSNSYQGGTEITGGRVNFNASGAAGTGSITVTPASAVTIADSVGGTTLTNNWTLNSSANTIDIFNSGSTGSVFTLSGNISGAGNLSRGVGGGTQLVALTGTNSGHTGSLILAGNSTSSSTPMFVAPGSFTSGNIQLGTTGNFLSVLLSNGTFSRTLGTGMGQLQWVGTGGTGFAARGSALTVTLNSGADLIWGSGSFVQTGQPLALGALNFADNVVTLTNAIDLGATQRTLNVIDNTSSNSDRAVLSGNLTGTAGFIKNGTGTLELTSTGSTMTGPIDIVGSGSTVAFSQGSNLGTATFVGFATTSAGILLYEGMAATSPTPGLKLSVAGVVNVANASATLTFANAGTGTSALTKTGAGTLEFTTAFSGSTSTTTVSGGTLALAGLNGRNASTGGSTVTSNATLFLDSSTANEAAQDRIPGAVTLNNGVFRMLANPSTSTTETLTAMSFTAGSLQNFITLQNNGSTVALTVTTFNLPATGTFAVLRGPNLGGASTAIFTNIGTSALLANMLGDASPTGTGNFFLQHDNTLGAREVVYVTNGDIENPTVPTTANFRNTGGSISNTIGAANTIATLTLNGTSPTINAASGTLTIASGGILVQGITTGAVINGGTLTTTSNAALNVITNSNLDITSTLVTTGGLNKLGVGTLNLARPLPNGPLAVVLGILNSTKSSSITTLNVVNGASFNQSNNLVANPVGNSSVQGTVAISGNYTLNGSSTQTLDGVFSVDGNVAINGGTLVTAGQSAVFTTPANGTITASATGGTSAFFTINNSSVVAVPNRAPNAPAVVLNSSRLTLTGNASLATDQTLGALRGSGFSLISIPSVTGSSNVLRFASLSTDPNVGWYFYGATGFGSGAPGNGVSNVFFTTPPSLSSTGGGLPGTTTVSIVPGVVIDNEASLGTLQGNLGTYSATSGLRELTTAEQQVGFTGSTINTNVIFSSATTLPAGTTSVNSVVNAGTGVALNGTSPGSTLIVGSGTVLYQFGSTIAGFGSLLTLDMNGQTGVINFTGASSIMIINSAVRNTSPSGLVINANQVSGGMTLGSTDAINNTFSNLTLNGGRGSSTSTTLMNTNFTADVNLGASTGRITLNSMRLTYGGTSALNMTRALRIGNTAELFTSQSITFTGSTAAFTGNGVLGKLGAGALIINANALTPTNLEGTPATLGINTTAGTTTLNLVANAGYTWKLRGSPDNYSQDLVSLAGSTTLTIDPTATFTADLAGIDYAALVGDVGPGQSRSYVVIDAISGNTASFATAPVLENAAGFSPSEFNLSLVNGDVVLTFTAPVPEPAVGLVVVMGLLMAYRRKR